jgi:hypothetical protein
MSVAACRETGVSRQAAIPPFGSDLSLTAKLSLVSKLACNGLQTLSGKFRGFGLRTPFSGDAFSELDLLQYNDRKICGVCRSPSSSARVA